MFSLHLGHDRVNAIRAASRFLPRNEARQGILRLCHRSIRRASVPPRRLVLSSHQNGLIQRQPTILNGIMIGAKVAIGSFLINKSLQFSFRNIARKDS